MTMQEKSIMLAKNWTLLSAIAVTLMACNKSPEPPKMPPMPVSVVSATPHDVPVAFEFVGQAAGSREIEVRARVGGILLKRNYKEGQPVKQGDLLFQIDPEPLQAILDQAQSNLKVQEAQLIRTQQDLNRIVPLFKENAVSQKDRDDAVAAYEAAKASVAVAQAAVRQARINLNYTRVTAPISGITSQETVSEGSLISADSTASRLTKISQLNPIYINFSTSDNEVLRLKKMRDLGQLKMAEDRNLSVHIRLADGSLYNQVGHLNFTDSVIDPGTGSINSRAVFANPQGDILPGQFVRVIVSGPVRSQVITVPQTAVLSSQQGSMVWVVGPGNKVHPQPIKVSDEVGSELIVEQGLKAGDRIVVDNIIKLRPGAEVQPQPFNAKSKPASAPTK